MNNKRLTIWIGEREALPVRAIPYKAGWERFSPDVVAKSFALGEKWAHSTCPTLTTYQLDDHTPSPVQRREWNAIMVKLDGYSEKLDQSQTNRERSYAKWRRKAVSFLPAGVFVWLDEFEKEYEADRSRAAIADKLFADAELILSPMLDDETRVMVMEGFEKQQKATEPKEDMADKVPVASPSEKDNLPTGLTTGKIAVAFQDIYWTYDKWKENLANCPKWLIDARMTKGARGRGRGSSTWNPVELASCLLEKNGALKSVLRNAFKNKTELSAWAGKWGEHEDLLTEYCE